MFLTVILFILLAFITYFVVPRKDWLKIGLIYLVLASVALSILFWLSQTSGWCLVHPNDMQELCQQFKTTTTILNEHSINNWM